MSIVLPLSEWEIISNKMDACEPLNPLEQFIYENLPAGEDEQLFYNQLSNALEYVVESAIKSHKNEMTACVECEHLDIISGKCRFCRITS